MISNERRNIVLFLILALFMIFVAPLDEPTLFLILSLIRPFLSIFFLEEDWFYIRAKGVTLLLELYEFDIFTRRLNGECSPMGLRPRWMENCILYY